MWFGRSLLFSIILGLRFPIILMKGFYSLSFWYKHAISCQWGSLQEKRFLVLLSFCIDVSLIEAYVWWFWWLGMMPIKSIPWSIFCICVSFKIKFKTTSNKFHLFKLVCCKALLINGQCIPIFWLSWDLEVDCEILICSFFRKDISACWL